jgi:hypothetical protein
MILLLLLFNLLQTQKRLSWFVIVAAVIALTATISLFVYFYKRYKRIEKETENEWDSSRTSLFVDEPRSRVAKIEQPAVPETVEKESPLAKQPSAGSTRMFGSDITLPSFTPEPETKSEPAPVEQAVSPVEPPAKPQAPPVVEAPAKPAPTEILASPKQPAPVVEQVPVEKVAADQELTADNIVPPMKPAVDAPTELVEAPKVARVEEKPSRAAFDSPKIERVSQREIYEPPRIEPLTPREASATRELRSVPSISSTPSAPNRSDAQNVWGTARLGSEKTSKSDQPAPVTRETRPPKEDIFAVTPMAEPALTGGASRSKMFGSVLGLPSESSHQPLVLGRPVKPTEEIGIGELTHYGQDLGPKGGVAGKIALFTILGLLVAAGASYVFVPSVHSRVGDYVAKLRGRDAQAAQEAAMKPKAQVIPSTRPEVNKSTVTARGAVDNLSDAPLENLSVEVSLQRGDGQSPEIRTIPVTPNPLPPNERGTFEFEYDGKRDTGFAGYTITRLLSNGAEVRFRAPGK